MSLVINLLFVLGSVAYLLAAGLGLRGNISGSIPASSGEQKSTLLLGLSCHFLGSALLGISFFAKASGKFEMIPAMVVAWPGLLVVLLFLGLRRRLGLENLDIYVLPVGFGFLFASLSLNAGSHQTQADVSHPLFLGLHILLMVLAVVFYSFSFGLGLATIVKDMRIKSRAPLSLSSPTPSLFRLEQLNKGFLGLGYLFLLLGSSFGLSSGLIDGAFVQASGAKLGISWIALGVYTIVTIGVFGLGWRSRRIAWMSVSGFVVILLVLLSIQYPPGS